MRMDFLQRAEEVWRKGKDIKKAEGLYPTGKEGHGLFPILTLTSQHFLLSLNIYKMGAI